MMKIGSTEFENAINVMTDSYFDKSKLRFVKAFRDVTGFGLIESKDIVDAMVPVLDMNFPNADAHELNTWVAVKDVILGRVHGIIEARNPSATAKKSDIEKMSDIAESIAALVDESKNIYLHDVIDFITSITRNKLSKEIC